MKSFQVADFNAPLQEVDAPTPQPSGTQVLIKVKAAGVCHSDLHIWEGGYDLGHGRKPLSLKDRGVSLPRTMGHETVGEVLAFGPDAKPRAVSSSATSRWSIPGLAAANARPASPATRICA
jgi:alcohol dehydrogenase/propanol-preferring alcohol dehydrogenase